MNAEVFITRQPVVNKHRAITANRLRIHARDAGLPFSAATETLAELEEEWPNERTVFVGFGETPGTELADWKAPQNAMIEFPAQALLDPEALALMRELDAAGTSMCLDGFIPGMQLPPAPVFHFLLADASRVGRLNGAPGLTIAAQLAEPAGFDAALRAGYDGAVGWFFLNSKPGSAKLTPVHSQIVRLLNLVRRNAEVRDIEKVLKQDVALAARLLRYINSAAFGLRNQIQSFRHAVTILGYEKLHKWLSVLLVTSSKDPQAPALMQTAIVRGRFMESLGRSFFDKSELDNLFITGAFSLLEALVGTSLEASLDEMHLPEAICDALIKHDGVYADFLDLALACEKDDFMPLADKAQEIGASAMDINRAHFEAISFADSLQF